VERRRQLVGEVGEFEASGRVAVRADSEELVVFRLEDGYVAFLNTCPHMGGPVCEGRLAPKVEADLAPSGEIVERFSTTERRLVCPWHGFEFKLPDGDSVPDGRYRLRAFEVEEDGGQVYVLL
jgi:nitrite reductase (NADH) small subunit